MGRLIDADELRNDWLENGLNEYVYDTNAFLESIDEQPTVEARPVVHGEWERTRLAGEYLCSNCQSIEYASRTTMTEKLFPFCPHCGADMRGKKNG